MIVCLHGFLGSGKDFSFLENELEIYAPNLDQLVSYPIDQVWQELSSKLSADSENILIGYSFGARLAMQLFLKAPQRFKKVIFLAGHAGLKNQNDLDERIKIEEQFKAKIKEHTFEGFLKYWNELSLFAADEIIAPEYKDQTTLSSYFENYCLSRQPFMLDKLKAFNDKIVWYYGSLDHKYSNYAKDNLAGFDLRFIESCGHRLLKNKLAQEQLIKEILKC